MNEFHDTVLGTISKLIGISEDNPSFNEDCLVYINSSIFILRQILNVDLLADIHVNKETKWSDLILAESQYDVIKDYLYCNCKLKIDPPTNPSILNAIKDFIKEAEWRLGEIKEI